MHRIAVFLLLLLLTSPFSQAQKRHEKEKRSEHRGVASFMELFTNLERDWATAIQKQDEATVDKLLAPEFVLRKTADATRVIDRSEWLRTIFRAYKIESFSQREMSVRVFPGEVAIVSFVQSQEAKLGNTPENGKFLVVDVWVGNRERRQWQVAQRYWASIPTALTQ